MPQKPPALPPYGVDPVAWGTRAGELDALRSIIPEARATQLAGLLTDDDVATLRHLAETGMGMNTLRALSSDLGYLEAWSKSATGAELPWPVPLDLVLKFVAHHLWDVDAHSRNPSHGMPGQVRQDLVALGLLRSSGPHAPATVRRRLSSWSTLHQWRDLEGPFKSPALRKAVRLSIRASPRGRRRKSREAVVGSVLEAVLGHLDDMIISLDSFDHGDLSAVHLAALRDRSVLSLGFASGGRRRSELTSLDCADIERRIWTGQDGAGGSAPAVFLHLGRTKTTDAQDDLQVAVIGRAVADLDAWLVAAEISAGPIFRPVDRWGSVGQAPLSPQTVNRIVKKRLGDAGFDAASYSAHGLRSGYLTEAFLQGLSLPEAMSQSGHKSVNQAASYFKAFDRLSGRAARLLD